MRALFHMFIANLKMTARNRMALFWNLAFPMIFIVLFGFLFDNDISLTVGVVGAEGSEVSQAATQVLEETEGIRVQQGEQSAEMSKLRDGDRAAVVVFTAGESPDQLNAEIYYDLTNPQQGELARIAVEDTLNQVNLATLGADKPVNITSVTVETEDFRYIDFLVPGILAMSIMTSGMVGLASAFVSYREKGVLRRIKATPFPLSSFIAARILSQMVVALGQAVVLISLGRLLFDLQISGQFISVFVVVLVGSAAFLSLGFVISSFAKNQEAADALANAIAFPMLFLAGVFFPVDSAPGWMQPITILMPLAYLADALREVMIHGASLVSQWLNILVLLVTATIGFLVSIRLFKWESSSV